MKMQRDKEMQRGRDEWMKGNKWIKRGKHRIIIDRMEKHGSLFGFISK